MHGHRVLRALSRYTEGEMRCIPLSRYHASRAESETKSQRSSISHWSTVRNSFFARVKRQYPICKSLCVPRLRISQICHLSLLHDALLPQHWTWHAHDFTFWGSSMEARGKMFFRKNNEFSHEFIAGWIMHLHLAWWNDGRAREEKILREKWGAEKTTRN